MSSANISMPDPTSSGQLPSTDDITKTFEFSPTTYEALEKLANGRAIGETLRDAIALSKWFNDAIKSGAKILVERHGKLYQVIKI